MDGRGLSPGLLAAVLSLANDLAAHGELVGGRRVTVLGVAPDDRVASLERVAARTNRCGRAVDEELPVRSGLRIIAKRLARVDGRGDGIEVPAPGSHAVIGGEAVLLEERLREVGGGRPRFERIRLGGSPRLLLALSVDANNRARRCDLGAVLTTRAHDRQRCRYVLVGKLGVRGIVGIALSIASVLLARQARGNDNLRVVLRLRDLEILCGDNRTIARLKQTPILPGHRVIARQINRNNTKGRRIGRCLAVAPGKVAVGIKICLLERVHVGRNGIGVLAIQNGGSIAGLRLFHKGQLGIELTLILRSNRKVEGLACRDLGVGFIGHRKGNLGLRRLGARQRLVDRAFVTVERDAVGARGVLDLVVLAVDIKRARARHLQIGGQAILVSDRVGAGVLDVVVGKGRIDLLLQCLLVGGDLLGIALDGHGEVVRALNVRRATAHKRNGCGQRNGTIARSTRHLAGVVAPAIAGRQNDIAFGTLPANLELVIGARAVRKREV